MVLWLSLLLLAADPAMEGCRIEVKKIDQQIEKLEKERELHAQKAQQYQQEGDRWRFSTNNIEDAYQAWGSADKERRQMQSIQLQIDELQERKDRIFQFYPQLHAP